MAFDQLGDSKSVLGIPKHKLATSEKQSSDCGVTYLPLGNPKDNLLLLPEANGVSSGVAPLWTPPLAPCGYDRRQADTDKQVCMTSKTRNEHGIYQHPNQQSERVG